MWRRGQKPRKSTIPGIIASDPELGNLGDIGRAGSLHQFLADLHRRFGPVTWFYWGKIPVVSVASPQAFQETRRLFDRPVSLFAAFEPLIGSDSIQYANGETGKYRRKYHYDASLSPATLRNDFFDIFQRVLRDQLLVWESKDDPISLPLHEIMLDMAMRSITLAAFGTSFEADEQKKLERAYNLCWNEMELVIQGRSMVEKRQLSFDRARNYFFERVKEVINRRRQRLGSDSKCFIDYLLEDQEHVLSEEHICSEVLTMFVGGFHTTGNLLTWIFYYLAKDHLIQERLFEELQKSYETEFPTIEQIDEMPYLNNIVNESLRLSVLAPWAARVAPDEGIVVCGHQIPAGTPIIQALGVVLEDSQIWTNPKQFNPDRFSHENKKDIPTMAFSPFGFAGKRICPGYRFANYEVNIFVAGIIKKYRVALVNPSVAVVRVHQLVTSPKDEIFVRFCRRSQ